MKKIHTYRRAIVFLVIIQYCLAIGYASDEAGCSHNGTMFADGSLVPSMEPCLNCKCVDAHLICSLRVCPEQPIPPPRGCVLVHKKLSCCPHLSCKKYHNENENEDHNRRIITYNSNWYNNDADDLNGDVDERQKMISKNSLYRRIDEEEIYGNDQMCVHNGTIYRTGSAMSTSSLCSYCYCIGGKQKCVRPKCLLASPGCVPVFIDSSCCPIRYDCGVPGTELENSFKTKTSFYRIENKHYNRMRSRAQRNRGCLIGSTYYPEGEKLPTDKAKPCDICFCIRGERKCTPKKCAPYIGNCKPKIPEGQCCPANYECDHSADDFGSSHKPRQFDLFSYFFGDETTGNETNKEPEQQPHSPFPDHSPSISSTSEKGFFDAIREGLNYIDSNDQHVEKILDSSGNNQTTTFRPLQNSSNELSLLEIFLSDDDDDDDGESTEEPILHNEAILNYSDWPTNFSVSDNHSTIYASDSSVELNKDRYALLDEQTGYETTIPSYVVNSANSYDSSIAVKTSNYDRSATENIIKQYITFTSVPNYDFESSTLSTNRDFETSTFMESTTLDPISPAEYETLNTILGENSNSWPSSNATPDNDIHSESTADSHIEIEEFAGIQTTMSSYSPFAKNRTDQMTTTEPSIVSTFFEEFAHLFGDKNVNKKVNVINSQPQIIEEQTKASTTLRSDSLNIGSTNQVSTQSPPILKTTRRINPTIISSPAYPSSIEKEATTPLIVTVTSVPTRPPTSTTPSTTSSPPTTTSSPTTTFPPTTSPPTSTPTTSSPSTTTPLTITSTPIFHYFPTQPAKIISPPSKKPTTTPPRISLKPTYTADTKNHQATPKISLTTTSQPSKPSPIGSNPSILDSDLNYDYGDQPTLPPSLPNLKIIPFLPTDAVRKDSVNVKPNYDYYPNNPTSYPVLTENYDNPFLSSDNLQNQNTEFTAFEVDESEANVKDTFNRNNENPDFNSYSIESTGYSNDPVFGLPNTNGKSDYDQYPSITEKPSVDQAIISKYPDYSKYSVNYDYDSFDPEKRVDANKYVPGSYEAIDGHEYNIQGRNPSFDQFVTEYPERRVYSKIEFSTSNPLFGFNGNNKFSPPSETEGGFLPKEPLDDDQYYEKFHTTKLISDIPTETSPKANISGQLIGITSEDPFKNVIRTEPPPNLLTLIEDKEKLFHAIPESIANIEHDYPSIHLSDIEKEIISITTDVNYNSTPEWTNEPLTDNIGYSINDTVSSVNITNSDRLTNNSTKYSTEVSVSSNFQPNPTIEPAPNDFLGSLLGYIFKDSERVTNSEPTEPSFIFEKQTIPPFKKISSTSLTLMDILNFTKPVEDSSKKVDTPQRKNNKIYEYPTTSPTLEETSTPKVENLNILRDVLLATLNSPSNIDPTAHKESHPTIDVPKPIYSSHSIHQFLNPIFSGNSELTHVTNKYSPIISEIDLTIPKLNSQIGDNKDELNNNVFGPESYQVLNDYPSISNSRPFGENPIDYDSLKERHAEQNSPNIYTQPLNSFQNSMGILKLAGCNIYGRMYRVGRIITELSNPCLECKCTEVGVHCTPLNC